MTLSGSPKCDTLVFQFHNEKTKRISKYGLKLLNIDDGDGLNVPKFKTHATVHMPSDTFGRTCKDIHIMGDSVRISVDKRAIHFSVDGDLTSANITQGEEEKNGITLDVNSNVDQSYPVKYLLNFTKASVISNHVTLQFAENMPMILTYPISKESTNDSYIRYYLAPKIIEEYDE